MISKEDFIDLCWARTPEPLKKTNFGDGLSPIIVSALSGMQCQHTPFKCTRERLVSTGTIGNNPEGGLVHYWGTGFNCNIFSKEEEPPLEHHFVIPENTKFVVHATRGKISEKILNRASISTPQVYGDPVTLLPKILTENVDKKYELGIIIHLSETEGKEITSQAKSIFKRYDIPDSLKDDVILINTYSPASLDGIKEKVNQIRSCKRILSTSLHGIVIPEVYEIPCLNFNTRFNGIKTLDLDDDAHLLDHRFRDFYSGIDVKKLSVYGRERKLGKTPWEGIFKYIDKYWVKKDIQTDNLVDSFPHYNGKILNWNELEQFR